MQNKWKMKLKWLKKLYKDAKTQELEQKDIPTSEAEEHYENPFDDQWFLQYDDVNFNDEVNNLIEWIDDLDYDKYI